MVPKCFFVVAPLLSSISYSLALPHHNRQTACSPDSFTAPGIFGLEFLNISASEVYNFTAYSIAPGTNASFSADSSSNAYAIDFCNVTVTYTHPGWSDNVHVTIWLPLLDWNTRLWALGGGGYSTAFGPIYLTQAVSKGFVAIETDGGKASGLAAGASPRDWALTSTGNVNLYLFENYGSRVFGELGNIGKAITQQFFGQPPQFSYFSGCSGGGRQGQIIAQNFPDDYDGILSVAPAINIENFIPAGWWAHQVMRDIGYYPSPCEVDAFTTAAISACDSIDGVEDGVISDPEACDFSAYDVVGKTVKCPDSTSTVLTANGAKIVEAAWAGPQNDKGNIGWFGVTKDTNLSVGYAATLCNSSSCGPPQTDLYSGWIQWFLAKDPEFVIHNMTTSQFLDYLQMSDRLYHSSQSAAFPDLTRFNAAGGKMISWHGLADEAIPPNGSVAAYQQVLKFDPNATDYYRFYEAPGVAHCTGGPGAWPNGAFDQLIAWVEDGVAPETLIAEASDGSTRPLCLYPSKQVYADGNFSCQLREPEEVEILADQHQFYWPS